MKKGVLYLIPMEIKANLINSVPHARPGFSIGPMYPLHVVKGD